MTHVQDIGNYRIGDKIGEGGMGAVYAAQHKVLGRPAAIKVLLAEHVEDEQLVARFVNEAKAATNIHHPGIVDVYDLGTRDDGRVFIAMELLEGECLGQRLRRMGTLTPAQAVLFTQQICSALQAAHGHGIFHRDLKPSNIFIVRDPQVAGGERIKLLDFGIAKFAVPGEAGAVATRAGAMLGTPQYMAPEQCLDSSRVDHRIDVYATGCLLFEMLCGRPPFVADTYIEILTAQMQDLPPRASSLRPEIDARLDPIIMKALAKNPAERFQGVSDLAAALHVVMGGSLPQTDMPELAAMGDNAAVATRAGSSGYARWATAIAAILVMGIGGAMFKRMQNGDAGSKTAGSTEPAVPAPVPPPPVPPPPAGAEWMQLEPGDSPSMPPAAPDQVTWILRTSPPGAEVRHDGEVVGNTASSLLGRTLREPARKQRIELRLDGYEATLVDLATTADYSEIIVLEPSVAVKLESRPTGAQVYLPDETYLGNTPLELTGGQSARQSVIVRRQGYREMIREIVFAREHAVMVKLERLAIVALRIESEPPGAEVWQGDTLLGTTPYADQLPKQRERIELVIKHEGCADKKLRLRGDRDDSALATLKCR